MQQNNPVDPTVVKISSPADVLGVLPYRLGFHPVESLVVVCLQGERRRDQMVMRFDLSPPEDDRALAQDVADRLSAVRASATVLACYTDAPAQADRLARAPLIRAIRKRLKVGGIELVEALLVRHGRWWSYVCTDLRCCPWEGTPLPEALTPAAGLYAAESVAMGSAVLPGRDALVRSVEPAQDNGAVARRAAAASAAQQMLGRLAARGGPAAAGQLALASLERLIAERSEEGYLVTPQEAAVIALGLRDASARDLAMTLALDSDDDGFVALLTELAREVADPDAAPLCSVLAWAAYARGGGALAIVAAERALRCEAGYPLAELVLQALEQMVPPSEIREVTAQVRAVLGGVSKG